ncbi:hypothetical protein Tco_0958117 [Tanacetum coccineum]
MDHRAYCALKNANPVLHIIGKSRFLKFNQVAELRNEAYEHSCAYKERRKKWHNTRIQDKEFMEGQEVLVFNSRLKLFPRKLKTRWYGPYTLSRVSPYETVEVIGKEGICFKSIYAWRLHAMADSLGELRRINQKPLNAYDHSNFVMIIS